MPVQLKASLWFLVCTFFQKAMSVISTPIFTRLLTPAQYGEYNVFLSWMSIISVIVTMNLSYGMFMQGLVKFGDKGKVYSSSLQGLTLLLCTGWTIIYFIFRDFFNEKLSLTTTQMIYMMIMIWATAAFQFWSSEQRVNNKYRLLVAITMMVLFMKPILGVILVLCSEDKATARILAMVLVEIAGYAWCCFIQLKRGKVFFSKKYWIYALKLNIPLIPHYLSQTMLYGVDRIMVSQFTGDDAAGIYSIAYSIAVLMTMFNQALTQTMGPWIYRKIHDKQVKDMASVVYSSLLIIIAANLTLILLAPEAVTLFAPPKYGDAIWVIPPVALSVFFMFLYDMFASFQFYYEKSWFIMGASIIGAALNIALNYLFLGVFHCDYVSAGYTTLICYMLYAVGHYVCMRWVCKKHLDNVRVYDPKVLLGLSVAFITAGLLLLMTYDYPILRYSMVGLIGVIILIFRKKVIATAKQLISIRKLK